MPCSQEVTLKVLMNEAEKNPAHQQGTGLGSVSHFPGLLVVNGEAACNWDPTPVTRQSFVLPSWYDP